MTDRHSAELNGTVQPPYIDSMAETVTCQWPGLRSGNVSVSALLAPPTAEQVRSEFDALLSTGDGLLAQL